MIQPSDLYWRRLLTWALGATIVLSLVAVAAFPGPGGHETPAEPDAPPPPAAGGLEVSDLDWFVWERNSPEGSHLKTWVNVTNPGNEPATNMTAEMRGATTAIVFRAGDEGMSGNVGRGGSSSHTFEVIPRTTARVSAQITSNSLLGSIGLEVVSPSGKVYAGASSGQSASVMLALPDVNDGVFGEWSATVSHTGGVRGFSYSLGISSDYTDAFENVSLLELPAGETYHFYFNIWADEPYTTVPPDLSITVNGTVVGDQGPERVSFVARFEEPVQQIPVEAPTGGGGALSPGEFLGFSAIAIIGLSVASGALRTRGGRATSQDRARTEVSIHRLAWLTVIAVLGVHGLVQLTSGHAPLGSVLLGTIAFGALGGIVWFNAYQRQRVLAMEWRRWLLIKVGAVAVVLVFVGFHVGLYGRHFG